MAAPIVLRSTDAGAPTLSGTAGDLLSVLNACLIINKCYSAILTAVDTPGTFTDNTNKARSQATAVNAGTFAPFVGPTISSGSPLTGDISYFGMTSKFGRLKLKFGTAGVQATAVTLVWEYWNGTVWTALSVADGSSGLTADGTLTWTIPSDWVTKSVNAVTQYYVRVRFTAGSWTINPLLQYATITGWTQAYGPTSNEISYQQGGGNSFFLDIQDNGASNNQGAAGAPTARDARVFSYETMSAVMTGTGQMPGAVVSVWRKSTTADATTRTWIVVADDRTVYLFVLTADVASTYVAGFAGDFYSMVPNDGYRFIIVSNIAETAGTLTSANHLAGLLTTVGAAFAANAGWFIQRSYTGMGSKITVDVRGDPKQQSWSANWLGVLQYPNGPDGGLYLAPLSLGEFAMVANRGRLRGLYAPCHAIANFADGDTISGANAYAGKTFLVIKSIGGGTAGICVVETSDTWETN